METRKCECGCGKEIPSRNKNGPIRYAPGHARKGRTFVGEKRNQKGEKNNNWRGGRTIDGKGYVRIRKPNHPRSRNGYVREHILIMEKHIGRYITEKENVHHKDDNKQNNKIENLELLTHGEHSKHHRKEELKRGKRLFQ